MMNYVTTFFLIFHQNVPFLPQYSTTSTFAQNKILIEKKIAFNANIDIDKAFDKLRAERLFIFAESRIPLRLTWKS